MRGSLRSRTRLVLPSASVVELDWTVSPPVRDDLVDGRPLVGGRLFRALEAAILRVRDLAGDGWVGRATLETWPLADFHALRDVAERLGVIAHSPFETTCANCDVAFSPSPVGRAKDDLESWYAVALEHGGSAIARARAPTRLPMTLPLPRGRIAETVMLEPVTVERALPLLRRAAADEPLRYDAALVRALGIVSLGDEVRPAVIARVLDRAPDDVLEVIEALYLSLNYSERAFYAETCASCGAVNEIAAAEPRELFLAPRAEAFIRGDAGDAERAFPPQAEFARMVERIGAEAYRAKGVANVALRVEMDAPAVDEAGTPLLGSYQPHYESDTAGYTEVRFVVTLYYRTFRSSYEQEAFDLEAEIRETIEHELEHHFYHLAGHDPMDEAERREARAEVRRTFGERTVRRAERRVMFGELRSIALFLLMIALLFGLVVFVSEHFGLAPG